MNILRLESNEKVLYDNKHCIINKVINSQQVLLEIGLTSEPILANIEDIKPLIQTNPQEQIIVLNDAQRQIAEERLKIINPLLGISKRKKCDVQKVADRYNRHYTTIYDWLKRFEESELLSSLADQPRSGGKGKSRLTEQQEAIIQDKIDNNYNKSKKSRKDIEDTIMQIRIRSKQLGVEYSSDRTVRRRIESISRRAKEKRQYGEKSAKDKFDPIGGKLSDGVFPLNLIQIDHTPVDIILVDEINRKSFKRPFLTMAIDVYSRLVTGFYLSFDYPSYLSVGMCLSRSILPKEKWLSQLNVEAEWPNWGIMKEVHTDNAREFIGTMLKQSCKEYNIKLVHRQIGKPQQGAYIETVFKTFSKKFHNLPGSTFSNKEEKGDFDSEGTASLTLAEFEKWLTIQVTKIYHKTFHSKINITPVEKYWTGLVGDDETVGVGIPPRIINESKVKLDFLPTFKRSVQRYGVIIDHIQYYSDVLRPYIRLPQKYIFRRDPRDISKVYFYDPNLKDYFTIPYNNVSYPPISIWEHRAIIKKLKDHKNNVDENAIFEAYLEQKEIENKAIIKTQKAKRKSIHEEVNVDPIEINVENNNYEEIEDKEIEKMINDEDIEFDPFN